MGGYSFRDVLRYLISGVVLFSGRRGRRPLRIWCVWFREGVFACGFGWGGYGEVFGCSRDVEGAVPYAFGVCGLGRVFLPVGLGVGG